MDDEGPYLEIPNEIWERDREEVFKMDAAFDEWKRTACEHKDMELASEYLSNISGMADLIQALIGFSPLQLTTKTPIVLIKMDFLFLKT